MELAGVLGDLHTLVRGSQRLVQPPGHERCLGVLQQDVWQAADQAALPSLDEHPLGLGPRFVGVADDHQQKRAVDGKVADRHSQQLWPDRADCGRKWSNLILGHHRTAASQVSSWPQASVAADGRPAAAPRRSVRRRAPVPVPRRRSTPSGPPRSTFGRPLPCRIRRPSPRRRAPSPRRALGVPRSNSSRARTQASFANVLGSSVIADASCARAAARSSCAESRAPIAAAASRSAPHHRVRGQPRGPFVRRRARRVPAAPVRTQRRTLHRIRRFVVEAARGGCEVPCSPVGVLRQGIGERPMGGDAISCGCTSIYRRADQRMPEGDRTSSATRTRRARSAGSK